MEPISLILEALSTGFSLVLKDTTNQAIKEAYNSLKELIKSKFRKNNKPEGETALQKYEEKPEDWKTPLESTLNEINASNDESLIKAAQHLIELVNKQQGKGKYTTNIGDNAKGTIIGDHSTVIQNFGKESDKV